MNHLTRLPHTRKNLRENGVYDFQITQLSYGVSSITNFRRQSSLHTDIHKISGIDKEVYTFGEMANALNLD